MCWCLAGRWLVVAGVLVRIVGVLVPWWQCPLSCGCVRGVAFAVIRGLAPFVVCVGALMFAGRWLAWGGARCVIWGLGAWPWWCVFRVLVLVVGWGSGWDVDGVLLNLLTLLLVIWFLLLKKFFFSFLLWGGGAALSITLSILMAPP